MSRPKAWNGSAWVDPYFWNGSVWKKWSAPVYGSIAIRYLFDANRENWTYFVPLSDDTGSASWTSGYIWRRTPGGLLSSIHLQSPDQANFEVSDAVTSVRFKYTWQSVKIGDTATDIIVYFDAPTLYGGTSSNDTVEYTSQAQSRTYTTSSLAVPANNMLACKPGIALNDGILGSGNQTELRLLQVELIDQNGSLVYKKTANGWEPKVWRGSSWI